MTNSVKSHVLSIVKDIENGYEAENCEHCGIHTIWSEDEYYKECECGHEQDRIISGMDYIFDSMETNYITDGCNGFLGARFLVAFGGPNIWIDTHSQTVIGSWWGENYTASYNRDEMDINGAAEELFGCVQ
jgi:hypothetical protein